MISYCMLMEPRGSVQEPRCVRLRCDFALHFVYSDKYAGRAYPDTHVNCSTSPANGKQATYSSLWTSGRPLESLYSGIFFSATQVCEDFKLLYILATDQGNLIGILGICLLRNICEASGTRLRGRQSPTVRGGTSQTCASAGSH